ncbi:MAG: tRNA 2-thiouridine(34) synthase MnmA, partial [Oscillospiraceae bacterium]
LVDVNKNILVALSGGVDSSVCVHLLKQQGFNVFAVVLKMSPCHDDTVAAAQASADSLDVPLTIVDMQKEFDEKVITYFVNEYKNGRTPNPCIFCNPLVKFKALIETANKLNCDLVATGHYAQTKKNDDGTFSLIRGESLARDQSYMLYRLGQKELSRLIFPLSSLQKDEVRSIASKLGLSCATAPDSQENCFIEDNDYRSYIENRIGKQAIGDFISPEGKPCGKHKGIINYTVGQRKGLGIALGQPVFIKKIDSDKNKIYLAYKGDDIVSQTKINNLTLINENNFYDLN